MGDKEVVMVANQQNGWALEFVFDELRKDKTIILEAARIIFSKK